MTKRTFMQSLSDSGNPDAFTNKVRRQRMRFFEEHFPEVLTSQRIEMLDVGGTFNYWRQLGYHKRQNVRITLLNLELEPTESENITSVTGDACNLSQFKDKQFDIVFSNSVIEHVGDYQRQLAMAKEADRVGKAFFIQTPNFWFPFEPHFLVLGYHYMPLWLRVFLLQRFSLGWMGRYEDKEKAIEMANSVRLLTKKEMRQLFPNATHILSERFFGLTKSIMAVKTLRSS